MPRQLIWALVLVAASFGLASAQETTTGSLTGQVVDTGGAAVPGATVTITSGQGSKNFITDGSGRFFAPYLTPGVYAVKVELSGFSPVEQKNVRVSLGQRLEMSGLVLKVGTLSEVVEVIGAAPVVDVTSTTVGGNLDADVIKRLPVGRNFTDSLYLVPGVSDSSGVGRANPSITGASGLDNSYVVDGVNITNTGFGGVGDLLDHLRLAGQRRDPDFIKETQVKTGGFEAEYGQATGGVVNVVTQSGTNEFHGSVYGYFRPDSLESDYKQLQSPNGTVNTTGQSNYDFGATLGGPLMQEQAVLLRRLQPPVPDPHARSSRGLPTAEPGRGRPQAPRLSYAGKLTWQATSNHKFDSRPSATPRTAKRATAHLVAHSQRHLVLQRADQLWRTQPVVALRRHREPELADRGLDRARHEQHLGAAVGRDVAGHGPHGGSQRDHRRHRRLRPGQRGEQHPVRLQVDEPFQRRRLPPGSLRSAVRGHHLTCACRRAPARRSPSPTAR